MRTKIVLADWQLLFVHGVEAMLRPHPEFQVVGTATDSETLLRVIQETRPDVVVLSRILPKRHGVGVIRLLRQRAESVAIVLLAADITDREVTECVELGVQAVVLKAYCSSDQLRRSIAVAATGGHYIDPRLHARTPGVALAATFAAGEESRLSTREIDIARQVASGLRNREIAQKLFIAESTVKVHLKKIYAKARVHNRVSLTAYIRDHGLL